MPDITVFVWIALLIAAIVVESSTQSLVAVWFMPGLTIGAILAVFGVPLWIGIVQFLVLTALLLILTRRFVRRIVGEKAVPTNADRVIGQSAIVTAPIEPNGIPGQVKVLGQVWSAQADDPDMSIPEGSEVTVLSMTGVRLIVSKVNH